MNSLRPLSSALSGSFSLLGGILFFFLGIAPELISLAWVSLDSERGFDTELGSGSGLVSPVGGSGTTVSPGVFGVLEFSLLSAPRPGVTFLSGVYTLLSGVYTLRSGAFIPRSGVQLRRSGVQLRDPSNLVQILY